MGDEFTNTAASSIADLAAKAANYTSNSAYPVYQRYTPEQLVKSVKSSGDELRALVGEIITNQLYEIIKERES